MNADMRPAAAVWHAVFYPVNVEAFERQMATFDRMRKVDSATRLGYSESVPGANQENRQ